MLISTRKSQIQKGKGEKGSEGAMGKLKSRAPFRPSGNAPTRVRKSRSRHRAYLTFQISTGLTLEEGKGRIDQNEGLGRKRKYLPTSTQIARESPNSGSTSSKKGIIIHIIGIKWESRALGPIGFPQQLFRKFSNL